MIGSLSVTDQQPASFRPTRTWAQKRIRELAADTSKLRWTEHIMEQMEARDITDEDVLRVLRRGDVETDPVADKTSSGWKVKVVDKHPRGRAIGVVTIIMDRGFLRLVTTEWEDHR